MGEGQKWMINKYLTDKVESIHYALLLEKPKHLKNLLKKIEVLVLGVFKKEDKNWKRFSKVVWKVHQGEAGKDYADAGVSFATTKEPAVHMQLGANVKLPAVLVYVDG